MKTALIQRYSIRVKMRGHGIELVVMDSRNGDIYYYTLQLPKADGIEEIDQEVKLESAVADASVISVKEDISEDSELESDSAEKEEVVNGETVHD